MNAPSWSAPEQDTESLAAPAVLFCQLCSDIPLDEKSRGISLGSLFVFFVCLCA